MTSTTSGASTSCFLALAPNQGLSATSKALGASIREAGFKVVSSPDGPLSVWNDRSLSESIALADCVVADISTSDPTVFLQLGLARALGKAVFLVCEEDARKSVESLTEGLQQVFYFQAGTGGITSLRRALNTALRSFRRYPRANRFPLGTRVKSLFAVDWEKIGGADLDNLCLELLTQLGYKRLQWQKQSIEIDLTAELPRKDPDGFEFTERWMITLGRNASIENVLEMITHDPDYFLHRLARQNERLAGALTGKNNDPITFLVISVDAASRQRELFAEEFRAPRRGLGNSSVRIRLWDRTYMTNLVYQFPPIGFKYFSDEGRSKSKFRKSPEQLYEENLDLSRRLVLEKDMRVRAERDAVWKEISFSAAHKMGNPIFAIETNLDPLKRRIDEHRYAEASEVIDELRVSVEKAKTIVGQFRSLAVSKPSDRKSTPLKPILDAACKMLKANAVFCSVNCKESLSVFGDAHQLGECFDELASNALHWFDKDPKTVSISAKAIAPEAVPDSLESGLDYVLVQFTDNGRGVGNDEKRKIFNAFYTTYAHGTGLGLALTRRLIEGHGGNIQETGKPGIGAVFEIYLPVSEGPLPSLAKITEMQAGEF